MQTATHHELRYDVPPEAHLESNMSASSSMSLCMAGSIATATAAAAAAQKSADPTEADEQPSKRMVKRTDYCDLTEDAYGVVSIPKYTREQKRQACPLVQWTNVDNSGRGRLQSAWRRPTGEEQWGNEHVAAGASSSGAQAADSAAACERVSNLITVDWDPHGIKNRCSLDGGEDHQTEGRCGVCNVASKLLPFRRITRERWRGKPRGTLLCTRCHLKSRWHPDE